MNAEQTLRAYVDAFNRGDVDALAASYAATTDYVQPFSPVRLTTPAAIKAFEAGMFGGFSDVTVEIEWLVGDGDRAAGGAVIRATHTGTMPLPDGGTLPPTGNRIEIRNADYVRVDSGGKIVEHRRYANPIELMMQLGVPVG
jgi:predicted ester cyclase